MKRGIRSLALILSVVLTIGLFGAPAQGTNTDIAQYIQSQHAEHVHEHGGGELQANDTPAQTPALSVRQRTGTTRSYVPIENLSDDATEDELEYVSKLQWRF